MITLLARRPGPPFFALLALTLPSLAGATQAFDVRDGQTITAIIASRELTRISIHGSASLEKVWVAAGHLQIQPDDQGDIFIKPWSSRPGIHMSFFVRDTDGATYTIIAETRDVPSETILLKPHVVVSSPAVSPARKPRPYRHVQEIKRLILAMAKEEEIRGFSRDPDSTAVPLWHETSITRVAVYTGYHFIGHVYTIANTTPYPLTLTEQEFLDFVPDIRAVALDHHTLPGGATTSLYLVHDATSESLTSPNPSSPDGGQADPADTPSKDTPS